ncbi:MAG: hypothetical protein ACK5M3_18150 [Dysgonomonas sp.]
MLAVFSLFCLSTFATAQIPDKIIYKGKEYKLHSNPLELYFTKEPDKRPKSDIMSSALWRGYIATFEIEDNILFLKDIETMYYEGNERKWRSVLSEVFPDQKKIKIAWMTGLLIIPYGEMKNYVHMGYASTYENYLLFEVNEGNIVKERDLKGEEYEKFKNKQFEFFKNTEKYKELVREMKEKDPDRSDEFIEHFLRI